MARVVAVFGDSDSIDSKTEPDLPISPLNSVPYASSELNPDNLAINNNNNKTSSRSIRSSFKTNDEEKYIVSVSNISSGTGYQTRISRHSRDISHDITTEEAYYSETSTETTTAAAAIDGGGVNGFDFMKWIKDYKLLDIKQVFIDHDMTTLASLNMNNPNFGKLSADSRTIAALQANPSINLFANITQGMQALNELRSRQTQSSGIQSSTGWSNSRSGRSQHQYDKLQYTLSEYEQLKNIQNYQSQLDEKHRHFTQTMHTNLNQKKNDNGKQIEQYQSIQMVKLDEMDEQIIKHHDNLCNILQQQKSKVLTVLNKYYDELDAEQESHEKIAADIDNTLNQCLFIIDEDIKHLTYSLKQCQNILYKYQNKQNNRDVKLEDFTFLAVDKQRESEINEILQGASKYYFQRTELLNDHERNIKQYIHTQIQFKENNVLLNINKGVYNDIINDIEKLIEIKQQHDIKKKEKEISRAEQRKKSLKIIKEATPKPFIKRGKIKWWKSKTIDNISGHWKSAKRYGLMSDVGFNEGVHCFNTQIGGCHAVNNNGSNGGTVNSVDCCIGITSLRQKKWTINGIDGDWPQYSDKQSEYAYFHGLKEDPYWKANETIGVILDIPKTKVSFWKSDPKTKLYRKIKEMQIKSPKLLRSQFYYFMITAKPDVVKNIKCNIYDQ